MPNKGIREEVGRVLGLYIQENGYEDAFQAANVQGKFHMAIVVKLLIIICKHIERLEDGKE